MSLIDIDKILCELSDLPHYETQISLQTVAGCNDPSYGTGRLTELSHEETDFVIPLFPNLVYTNGVIDTLGMHRTRLMRMKPSRCYSYHQDPTKRIHIPLITNENCFMVINDIVSRYPADGSYYLVDTTQRHTFINASSEERIHIVGCVS